MHFDSDALAAFAAVARTGSFTGAARRLGITQPALSARIRKLEELLADRVLLRSRAGCTLTPLGERLLRHVQAVEAH
jgi:molybdate transport repressor ModE-like protein